MPVLLFHLKNVPDDESEEVRALLSEHAIDYYETHAGPWGTSVAAIWLYDDTRLAQARALLEDYQQRRSRRFREEYAADQEGFIDRLRRQPLRLFFYLLVIALVLYLSFLPVIGLGR